MMAGGDDEAAGATDAAAVRRRRSARRVAGAIALIVLALLALLYLLRRPVAQHFIDRELARRGVPARYRVADLGFGRQRLTGVVIGDPARPDLTADWVETTVAVGFRGARLTGVRAGRVRVRARVADGRLSLGSLDRLLPASGETGGGLPAIGLDLADARARVATPWGTLSAALAGRGRLDGGFAGRLVLGAPQLGAGACSAQGVDARLAVGVAAGRPTLAGPVRTGAIRCGGVAADGLAGTAGGGLDRSLRAWTGWTRVAAVHVEGAGIAAEQVALDLSAEPRGRRGEPRDAAVLGTIRLAATRLTAGALLSERAEANGRFLYDARGFFGRSPMVTGFMPAGEDRPGMRVALRGARVTTPLPSVAAPLRGTPLAPIAARLEAGVADIRRRFDLDADVRPEIGPDEQGATVSAAVLRGASGGEVRLLPGGELGFHRTARFGDRWTRGRGWAPQGDRPGKGVRASGTLIVRGGGLPQARLVLRQRAVNMPVAATLAIAPYVAGDARLALTGVEGQWLPGPNGWNVSGVAMLSGPFADGAVEGLTMPVAAAGQGDRLRLNPGCSAVRWRRIAAGGLALDPGAVRLCATGPALASLAGGRAQGGAVLGATTLTGRLGTNALDLRVGGARLALAGRTAALEGVALRLGDPARPVRLEATRLEARATQAGLAGRFAGASGRVGAVPLAMSDASGAWQVNGGALALTGALRVADTAASPRFRPLAARAVTLTLKGGAIRAAGTLAEPGTGTVVATVVIDHALSAGRGGAAVQVPGIVFAPGFQPDRLTPLTFGVIADVRGTVSGDARLAWGPDGVTSTGTFRTEGTDLAAAFGPVAGLATEIRFTDLLALESAPGQVATVATINPGIPVEGGLIRYQTLPGARVRVEGARWPFAGGTLALEPALLDFGATGERRLTFTVAGVAADRFLQQFDFRNLGATGVFDGTLPMVFDATGGRIERGRLTVRPGGGTIAYLGEVSRANLGFWGNLAFGALRSLRYRDLLIGMNGSLAGEMVTDVRFSGVSQGEGATSNFLTRRLQRLPFVFNVHIAAPFRGLIDSAQGFYDARRLIARHPIGDMAPGTLAGPVQPPASEPVP